MTTAAEREALPNVPLGEQIAVLDVVIAELEPEVKGTRSIGRLRAARATLALWPELVAALKELLLWYGRPRREEWLNDASYYTAVEVGDKARALLARVEKAGL